MLASPKGGGVTTIERQGAKETNFMLYRIMESQKRNRSTIPLANISEHVYMFN